MQSGGGLLVLAPFVMPSLVVISKKIYFAYKATTGDFSGRILSTFIIATVILIVSPFITAYRFFVRIKDYRVMSKILRDVQDNLEKITHIINILVSQSSSRSIYSDLESDMDEEFHFDLTSVSNFVATDTGEIIRTIDRR